MTGPGESTERMPDVDSHETMTARSRKALPRRLVPKTQVGEQLPTEESSAPPKPSATPPTMRRPSQDSELGGLSEASRRLQSWRPGPEALPAVFTRTSQQGGKQTCNKHFFLFLSLSLWFHFTVASLATCMLLTVDGAHRVWRLLRLLTVEWQSLTVTAVDTCVIDCIMHQK